MSYAIAWAVCGHSSGAVASTFASGSTTFGDHDEPRSNCDGGADPHTGVAPLVGRRRSRNDTHAQALLHRGPARPAPDAVLRMIPFAIE